MPTHRLFPGEQATQPRLESQTSDEAHSKSGTKVPWDEQMLRTLPMQDFCPGWHWESGGSSVPPGPVPSVEQLLVSRVPIIRAKLDIRLVRSEVRMVPPCLQKIGCGQLF